MLFVEHVLVRSATFHTLVYSMVGRSSWRAIQFNPCQLSHVTYDVSTGVFPILSKRVSFEQQRLCLLLVVALRVIEVWWGAFICHSYSFLLYEFHILSSLLCPTIIILFVTT